MPARPANPVPRKRHIVRVLMAFVLLAICAGSIVALVIYADAHSLSSPVSPVNFTQDNLLDLSEVAEQLDRIELDTRLFRITASDEYMRAAQGAAVDLNTVTMRLQVRLDRDPAEAKNAAELTSAALRLTSTLNQATPDRTAAVREPLLACHRIVGLMQDKERQELDAREQQEQKKNLYQMGRRMLVVAAGAALILVLFGFLVRDILRRGKIEAQVSEANERLRLTVERLEQQAAESRLLIAARDEVGLCLEVKKAQEVTIRYLAQLLPGTAGSLCIINNSRQLMESVETWGGVEKVTFDGFAPETCCAIRSGRIRWRKPDRSEIHCTHFAGKAPERYLCLPLTAHGETLGILTIELPSADVAAMAEARESTLISLGEMAAMAISGLHLRETLESQSIRDGLTSLFNRSFMEIALERELTRASRQAKQVAVMMLDIDHFKQFNDTFGHEAGDVVLREVADAMRLGVRGEDIVCRYGGEEFVIIMPEITTRAAVERAELLRRLVGDLALRYRGQLLRQVTISVGLAMYPDHSDSPEELLRTADHALYAAKHKGRNCVVQADSVIRA
ncbi:MAG TPA: GGDEF domain-containing protein [Acidobacteriaceae bacterium]|nr:GGDEF domain-containing protein [Acidobacteriaceae bacterium]